MRNTTTPSYTNQWIQELRDQWMGSQHSSPPSQLWILCWDASMDGVARHVRNHYSALVLRNLTSSDPDVGDAVDFALTELGVSEIVLCGHSQCHGSAPEESESELAPSNFLARVHRGQKRNQDARNHLIEQLQLLKARPVVSRALAQNQVTVDGLFYVNESGMFSRHDETTGQFVAIIDNVAIG